MQLYVCVKHVPDTAANIKVVGGNGFDNTVKFIVNPYDEYAVEEALKIRTQAGEGEVIVVTIGPKTAVNTLRSALAAGADRGILVVSEDQFINSETVSQVLCKAIKQDGTPDIIFTGKQSIDSEGGQTHYRLAQLLGMPVLSEVVGFSLNEGTAIVETELGGGSRDIFEISLPCVIGATKGLNEPRYPKLPDILKAKKKPIKEFSISDFDEYSESPSSILFSLNQVSERSGAQMLEGTSSEQVDTLVKILKETEKVL
jgi:electron transfer flavoprotein beta subunit